MRISILIILLLIIFQGVALGAGAGTLTPGQWEESHLRLLANAFGVPLPDTFRPLTGRLCAEMIVEFEDRDDFKKVMTDPFVKAIYERLAGRFAHEINWTRLKTGTIKDLTGRFAEHGFFVHPVDSMVFGMGARDRTGTFVNRNYNDPPRPSSMAGLFRPDHQLAIRQFFAFELGESISGQWMPQNSEEKFNSEFSIEKLRMALIIYNVQLAAGRDHLIWGYGKRGDFLLSDNAGPYDFISLQSFRPFKFPWVFKYLGSWHLQGFGARIRGNRRDFDHPYLIGTKLNWAPWPWIESSVARTLMALGEGRPAMGSKDWLDAALGRNEHTYGQASDTNQLFQFDMRLHFGFLKKRVDMGSLSAYWEFATESFSRDYSKPYVSGNLLGMEYDDTRWGIWGEWGTTLTDEVAWYSHYVYTDGYTQKDKIIGHPMGPFATDYAIGGWFFATPILKFDFETTLTTHEDVRPWIEKDLRGGGQIGVDAYLTKGLSLRFEGSYGRTIFYENIDPTNDIRLNAQLRWTLIR